MDVDDLVTLTAFAELLAEQQSSRATTQDPIASRSSQLRTLRRKDPSFPQPRIDVARNPQFSLDELVRWWAGRPAGHQLVPSAGWWFKRSLDAVQRTYGGDAAKELVLGLLLAHEFGVDDLAQQLTAAVPRDAPARVRVERALDELVDGGATTPDLAGQAWDDMAAQSGPVANRATATVLARVIAGLAAPVPTETVVDLACGEGSLLMALHQAGARHLRGLELDPVAWPLAEARHRLARTGADLGRGPADAFTAGVARADVVVADPPFVNDAPTDRAGGRRPPRQDLFSRWLTLALETTADSGRAVVALPGRVLDADRPELRRFGAQVRAVVVLPSRVRPDSSEPVVLWLLGRTPSVEPILLMNLDGPALSTSGGPSDVMVEEAIEVLDDWAHGRRLRTKLAHRRIERADVTERHVSLHPADVGISDVVLDRAQAERIQTAITGLEAALAGHPELRSSTLDRALSRLASRLHGTSRTDDP